MTAKTNTVTIYGIKNCDTMKKAFAWLNENNIPYEFHDYKKSGAPQAILADWVEQLGWETVVNRKGTTWRKLDESVRNTMDEHSAIATMVAQPSLIKRPILIKGHQILAGFTAEQWQAFFASNAH